MRTYLIDAYNLMHAVPGFAVRRGRHAASRQLVVALAEWAANRRERVVVVFDGAKPRDCPPAGRLELRFMLDRADADLMDLLDRGGLHTLVSKDQELVDYATALGHPCLAPRAFWSLVEGAAPDHEQSERDRPLSAGEVEYWLEEFGDPQAAARRRAARVRKAAPGLPPEEVQEWLDYFGEGEGRS